MRTSDLTRDQIKIGLRVKVTDHTTGQILVGVLTRLGTLTNPGWREISWENKVRTDFGYIGWDLYITPLDAFGKL